MRVRHREENKRPAQGLLSAGGPVGRQKALAGIPPRKAEGENGDNNMHAGKSLPGGGAQNALGERDRCGSNKLDQARESGLHTANLAGACSRSAASGDPSGIS